MHTLKINKLSLNENLLNKDRSRNYDDIILSITSDLSLNELQDAKKNAYKASYFAKGFQHSLREVAEPVDLQSLYVLCYRRFDFAHNTFIVDSYLPVSRYFTMSLYLMKNSESREAVRQINIDSVFDIRDTIHHDGESPFEVVFQKSLRSGFANNIKITDNKSDCPKGICLEQNDASYENKQDDSYYNVVFSVQFNSEDLRINKGSCTAAFHSKSASDLDFFIAPQNDCNKDYYRAVLVFGVLWFISSVMSWSYSKVANEGSFEKGDIHAVGATSLASFLSALVEVGLTVNLDVDEAAKEAYNECIPEFAVGHMEPVWSSILSGLSAFVSVVSVCIAFSSFRKIGNSKDDAKDILLGAKPLNTAASLLSIAALVFGPLYSAVSALISGSAAAGITPGNDFLPKTRLLVAEEGEGERGEEEEMVSMRDVGYVGSLFNVHEWGRDSVVVEDKEVGLEKEDFLISDDYLLGSE